MAAGPAPIMTDAADGGRNSMSSTGLMRAASDELQMPATLRWYLAHERAILGTLVVMLFLIGWEGLERGWWADALRPLLGASAERLRLKPIFISSPTLIAAAAFRMFFVTGEIWRDLAWSGVGYVLGLGLASRSAFRSASPRAGIGASPTRSNRCSRRSTPRRKSHSCR